MDMAEQLAEISDKNRELGRQKIAFERRLDEVEQILSEKDNKLEEAEMARNIYKQELDLITREFRELEQRNQQLSEDNARIVRQFIELKEKMGNAMNDALGGRGSAEVRISLYEESSNLDMLIKPEYL